jgi:hypothetical protein
MKYTYEQLHREMRNLPAFKGGERNFKDWEIKSRHDAAIWIMGMHHLGVDFHWDDNPSLIVNAKNKKLFTDYEATIVRQQQVAFHNFDGWLLYEDEEYGEALCKASGLTYGFD